ncbi:MAG: pyruvate kinase [bacterium]
MNRHTKIVATLGPASSSTESVKALVNAGVNVIRFNCAHGSWVERGDEIERVRQAAAAKKQPIGILLDLAGPKIRLGVITAGTRQISPGDKIELVLAAESKDALPVPVPEFFRACRLNNRILLGDGYIELKITQCDNDRLETKAISGGVVKSHHGITLMGKALDLEPITPKDEQDLEQGIKYQPDFISLSYIRSAAHINDLKEKLAKLGGHARLVAKIETQEAVNDIENIIEVCDVVMVARGDLGLQLPIENVPTIQKQIIRLCNRASKPVITATQMLESMIANPRPTRAEVTDVANAILDGTDAVMLSGETAMGQYPVETVTVMGRIAQEAETGIDHGCTLDVLNMNSHRETTEAVAQAVCALAESLRAKAIVTATTSGYTAQMVSRFRPRMPIVAPTSEEGTYRSLALVWGVRPLLIDKATNVDELMNLAMQAGVKNSLLKAGDKVVFTCGVPVGNPGSTNLISVRTV